MYSILDIDLDYFNLMPDATHRLHKLLFVGKLSDFDKREALQSYVCSLAEDISETRHHASRHSPC